jgi:transposase-like protein
MADLATREGTALAGGGGLGEGVAEALEEVDRRHGIIEVDEAMVRDLTPAQARAVALLLAGRSVSEIAGEVGVHRVTLHKWMKRHAGFAAAYNQWHQTMRETAQSRLMMLAEKAADSLEKALEAGDGRLAMRYFEKMGLVNPSKAGATDVESIKKSREIARKKKVLKQRRAAGEVMMEEMMLPPGF